MTYFSESYSEAYQRFRTNAQKYGTYCELSLGESQFKTGICWVGNLKAKRVFMHTCGLHGVEGYAGSAIQLALLNQQFKLRKDEAILLVHVINPFGMHYNRRFNENNVDLNRNFIKSNEIPPTNPMYHKLEDLLNPKDLSVLAGFKSKAILKIMRFGFSALQQSIAQGQYDFPRGIFYGGDVMSEMASKLSDFLKERLKNASEIFGLDVHTGLGRFSEENLFLEGFYNDSDYDEMSLVYHEKVIWAAKKSKQSYQIEGGWIKHLNTIFPNKRVLMITQEFGVAKPLKVLEALRLENFTHHYREDLDLEAKQALKTVFCPNDRAWRKCVVEIGCKRMRQLIASDLKGV